MSTVTNGIKCHFAPLSSAHHASLAAAKVFIERAHLFFDPIFGNHEMLPSDLGEIVYPMLSLRSCC